MALPMTGEELADRALYAEELEQLARVTGDGDSVQHYQQKAASVRGSLPIMDYIQRDRELLQQWREADQTGIPDVDGRVWSEANAVQAKVAELAAQNAYRPGLLDEVNRLLAGGSALDTPLSKLAAAITAGSRQHQPALRMQGSPGPDTPMNVTWLSSWHTCAASIGAGSS